MTDGAANIRRIAGAGADERTRAIEQAAESLRKGLLAVIPTETVYGVAASAASPEGLARLRALVGEGPWAWHAPSLDDALGAVSPPHASHRQMLTRLLPGPVSFQFEAGPDAIAAIRGRIGALPGAVDDARTVLLRVPEHAAARQIARSAGVPIVAAGWDRTRPIEALVLDDGPTRYGKPSTRVLLSADGAYTVLSEGALEERYIRPRNERTILFVCTGNTCRSPMAAAIARHLAQRAGHGRTRFGSAGTMAGEGMPATPEAVAAMDRLGIDLSRHRSRPISRQVIREADAVYVMTPAHARAVLAEDPSAAAKVHTIDPSGADVPDPIGMPQEAYERTAARLLDLIGPLVKELDA